jgi:hypothetical protein
MDEMELNFRHVNDEVQVEIPESDDRSINFPNSLDMDTIRAMATSLLNELYKFFDGDEFSWDVEWIEDRWMATDEGRWRRYEWFDGKWLSTPCFENVAVEDEYEDEEYLNED